MRGEGLQRGALVLAVLAGAPAADTLGHGLWTGATWALYLVLAATAWHGGRRMLASEAAAAMASAIVCATAAATVSLLLGLLPDAPFAAPPESVLLMGLAATAATRRSSDLSRLLGVAVLFPLTGLIRSLLPPMAPAVAAATGLALLTVLAMLAPRVHSLLRPAP